MTVNKARIEQDLRALAAIGRGPEQPGITRLAFSAADQQARRLIISRMRAIGLQPRIDAVGNIFGLTPAALARPAATVLMGSHLDTVPAGGAYDGVTGVVAALEVVRSLATEAAALPPLGVAVLACEESSRFRMATVGSKVLAGILTIAEALALTDAAGVTYGEAVAAHGNWDEVGGPQPPPQIGAYLELHVEQGRELELSGHTVAAVERIAAPTRLAVTLEGEAAHSGATPLYRRKDALAAAAEVILAVERLAETEAEHGTVGTTTLFAISPAAINVVPGSVTLGVDVRGVDSANKQRCIKKLQDFLGRLALMREIKIDLKILAAEEPVTLAPPVVEAILAAAAHLGLPQVRLDSRAGHDAMYMQRLCPSGLIFVPSTGGISHHPDEHTPLDAIAAGTEVLLHTARSLALTAAQPQGRP